MHLAPNTRLGHYVLVSLIGEGGMGEVYRATDTRLQRDVALKVLPSALSGDARRLARLVQEARALASLTHPNIVTIHSVEEDAGVHFLAMEFVEGQTLEGLIPPDGFGLDAFLAIALPLTDAVAAAHAAGLTHRDLKPQNVMVSVQGRLKVLDFGLARFEASSNSGHADLSTLVGGDEWRVVGTIGYLAPEQAEGKPADARSDVFSLGVILYEMATGRRPFARNSTLAALAAVLRDDPPPLESLAPTLPAALHEIIMRCLSRDPIARFPTAAMLCQELRTVRSTSVSMDDRPITLMGSIDARRRMLEGASDSAPWRSGHPPLVGRGAESVRLRELLAGAASGSGAIALISGEPGVGKTRLAEEVLREARRGGAYTMSGHCAENGALPYAPFIEILEQMLREVPGQTLREAIGDDASVLAMLVPKIRRQWKDIAEAVPYEPEQQRRATFDAMLDVLRRLAAHQPIVLLVDDVHWGDEATIGLLRHLAGSVADLGVLCLATYRDVELEMREPFAAAISSLVRQRRSVLLPVRCLQRGAVAELLAGFVGREPPAVLVDTIFHETEGNPFFVRELFQHLSEEGQLFDSDGDWKHDLSVSALNVPQSVRLVIGHRLARLTEPCQALLTTAAVIGRQFDLQLLEAVGTLTGDAFLSALEEAEAAQLLAPIRKERHVKYTFTHELVRSTLLGNLSVPRRQRVHAAIARSLKTVHGAAITNYAASMAHHLFESGTASDEAETIRFLALASDQAVATGAIESGLEDVQRALSIAGAHDARTRAELLRKQGLALRGLGRLMEAIDAWESAFALCNPTADQSLIAALALDLAHGFAWTGQPAKGVAAVQRALAIVGDAVTPDRCRLLGSLGWNLALASDFEAADPVLRNALSLAESLDDAELLGDALLFNSWHYYLCMRRREQADICGRAVELFRQVNDLGKLGEALVNFQMASVQIGRAENIASTIDEARTLAERLGRFDIRVHQRYSEGMQHWMRTGDINALDVALSRIEDVALAWRWVAEGMQAQAQLWRGSIADATTIAHAAVSHEPPGTTHTGLGWGMLFFCECCAGQRDVALTTLAAHTGELPRAGTLNTIGAWSALLKVVEGLVVLGERERAAALYPMVCEAIATESVVVFDGSQLLQTVAGMAAAAGGQWDAAEAHYQTALQLADTMPFAVARADTRYWYARLRMDRDAADDRVAAHALASAAVAMYRALNMPWYAARATSIAAATNA